MPAPQGRLDFPGLHTTAVMSGSFTLTHGISPSIATITGVPLFQNPPKVGTLTISYGQDSLQFPDCAVVDARFSASESGSFVTLTIQDRRWKWKFGRISGKYNERRREKLVAATEKTPQQLATLCLQAMGEQNFNVAQMPNLARPFVDWDYEVPAEALARLCDDLACRVVLRVDNTVHILPVGQGAVLPNTPEVTEASVVIDPPEPPDSIVVVSDPVKYEADFLLEAVGAEPDGTIKKINQLSYTPAGGWGNESFPDFPNVQAQFPKQHELAKQWIWRAYRIAIPYTLPKEGALGNIELILPLDDRGAQLQLRDDLSFERVPAKVFGKFWLAFESLTDNVAAVSTDTIGNYQGVYPGSFSLDVERGIVLFSEPVVSLTAAGAVNPPTLYLRTAVPLRNGADLGIVRHEFTQQLANNGTAPRYEIRPDVKVFYFNDPVTGNLITNLPVAQTEANYYLNLIAQEYQLNDPASVSYAGFVPIQPDGAIQQVTWQVDGAGYATTRASRNRETDPAAITYKEARFLENLRRNVKNTRI